jgi:hypothetical protein
MPGVYPADTIHAGTIHAGYGTINVHAGHGANRTHTGGHATIRSKSEAGPNGPIVVSQGYMPSKGGNSAVEYLTHLGVINQE